jgi:16S rRNA (guanine1516-N2)-methyltransferase
MIESTPPTTKKFKIAISYTSPELRNKAEQLADKLQLAIATNPPDFEYLMLLTPDYLGLQKTGDQSTPLYIDFLSPQMQFRQRNASLKNESLARALSLKKNPTAKIIDATGGLARDSFILASLGFDVTLLERSPIIHALIADGIQRAQDTLDSMQRLHLIHANAITWLAQLADNARPDIIYLDPMFEERKKSALPKKEMLIFHDIVGDDTDSAQLLNAALACAKQRVVVKRARLAQPLNEIKPSYSTKGNSCRFDIYLGLVDNSLG